MKSAFSLQLQVKSQWNEWPYLSWNFSLQKNAIGAIFNDTGSLSISIALKILVRENGPIIVIISKGLLDYMW